MSGLTKKQHSIFTYIVDFVAKKGYSPSYREIMAEFALSSPGSVYKYIQTLKQKGFLSIEKGRRRAVEPKQHHSEPLDNSSQVELQLPFIGFLEEGRAIQTFPHTQSISVPRTLVQDSERTYVIRIHGHSFHDEHLEDGDLLLVEARTEAQAGETVLVIINQHSSLIFRYYPEGQYVYLKGKNPSHNPLVLRHADMQIQGVVVALLRAY